MSYKNSFLVWTSTLALSFEKMEMLTHFMRSASALIEEEINKNGGIGGRPVEIIYKHFQKGPEGISQLKNVFEESRGILATNGHFIAGNNNIISNEIVPRDTLLFCPSEVQLARANDNVFNISLKSDEHCLAFTEAYFNKLNPESKIVFFHENKRLAKIFKNKFGRRKNFTSVDLLELSAEDKWIESIPELIKNLKNTDVLLLDVKLSALKIVFDYLNANSFKLNVVKYFGSIEGRFDRVLFPLVEVSTKNSFLSLPFQELCEKINPNYSYEDMDILSDSFWRLEIPLLVAHVAKNLSLQDQLDTQKIAQEINKLDGVSDVFIGKIKTYTFDNFRNTNRETFAFSFPLAVQKNGQITKTFTPFQVLSDDAETDICTVNFVYVDLIRITDIDIGSGTWGCEFYLDLVSDFEDPIKIINFNNLSMLNSKYEYRLIRKIAAEMGSADTYRYFISANFDFAALADNYPFDMQHIFISLSISNSADFGILQPVPWQLLDYDFHLEGWKLKSARTGYLKRKEVSHISANLKQVSDVREEVRLGWTVSRTNAVTVMKVGIPLSFLVFLNYYTVFLPFDEASSAVGILTTTFLSGIALYFSTEKPQPLRMTTVDLIFIYYYLQVGLTIVVLAISSFVSPELYSFVTMVIKIVLPLMIVTSVFALIKRVRSIRLRPRIDAI